MKIFYPVFNSVAFIRTFLQAPIIPWHDEKINYEFLPFPTNLSSKVLNKRDVYTNKICKAKRKGSQQTM